MSRGKEKNFKWPYRPIRADSNPISPLHNHPLFLGDFELCIIAEHAGPVRFLVEGHGMAFCQRFMWDVTCRPDLAVGMRVGTSYGRTLVLEDLTIGVR